MTCVCFFFLAMSNAVSPSYRRGSEGGAEVQAATAEGEGGGCGRRGEAARRICRAPSPQIHPATRPQAP